MANFEFNRILHTESFLVTRQQKEDHNRQKAFVVWLTGLPCSGKSTVARNLEVKLFHAGIRTMVLDGDNTRQTVNRDLDFSVAGRRENIRRVAEIARLLNDAGVVVITALISPFRVDRELAREIIGSECFIEVFVDASIEVCMERDNKGLYRRAFNGELKDFTGVNSPYEAPSNPQIILQTAIQTPEESVTQVMDWLSSEGWIRSIPV